MGNDIFTKPDSDSKVFTVTDSFIPPENVNIDIKDPFTHVTLSMEGKDFLADSSYRIELRQYTNDHDCFTIITTDDALDSFEGYVLENSKNILGKNIIIRFNRFGQVTQSFSGIITSIKNRKNKDGGYGKLYITGHSPSILLENGKDCESYENSTLEQIISKATEEYSQNTRVAVINPNTKYTIPYTVQYKESDYQFIKRLANRYGEYFYYDGQNLVFGNKIQPVVNLEENVDLIDVELEMNIKSQDFSYIAYDSVSAEIEEKHSDSVIAQPKENTFQSVAINASKNVFHKKAHMFFTGTSFNHTGRDLEEMVKRQKESRQHLTKVKGKSQDPELRIAGIAKIFDINSRPMETYRITEIFHYYDGNEYYNEFIGIPDILISPLFDEEAYPLSEEQPATVTDNDHPQGMIRVQFPWQKKRGHKTPWLRVVTPYAGKGKGMHIIPEIGEEVIIGFESGNAERPFVYGSMFNGKENAGIGGLGNYMKALQSSAGQFLRMNDKDGSLGMKDAIGSMMKFDGLGNAVTDALKSHNVNAGESHSTGVGGQEDGAPQSLLQMDQSGDITLNAQNSITLNAQNTITINVGNSSITLENDQISIKSDTIDINGEQSVGMNGKSEIKIGSDGTIEMTSKSSMKINGADIELNKS